MISCELKFTRNTICEDLFMLSSARSSNSNLNHFFYPPRLVLVTNMPILNHQYDVSAPPSQHEHVWNSTCSFLIASNYPAFLSSLAFSVAALSHSIIASSGCDYVRLHFKALHDNVSISKNISTLVCRSKSGNMCVRELNLDVILPVPGTRYGTMTHFQFCFKPPGGALH